MEEEGKDIRNLDNWRRVADNYYRFYTKPWMYDLHIWKYDPLDPMKSTASLNAKSYPDLYYERRIMVVEPLSACLEKAYDDYICRKDEKL